LDIGEGKEDGKRLIAGLSIKMEFPVDKKGKKKKENEGT